MLTGVLVLVVDRNPMSAFMAEWELRQHGGEAHVVRRVDDALSALAKYRFDFALVDAEALTTDTDRFALRDSLEQSGVPSLLVNRRSGPEADHLPQACLLPDCARLPETTVACIAYCVMNTGRLVTTRFS